ncbi:Uncharacterized protein dnm_038360 [Desulfonema magnum]|uniref:Uncharacterized protein n=1 Tax=Desulfonema magnum TaxID=45655 RepID=A0A975BLA5_9BACT|nr:Uncharacterized protein dnm_038360 [Desulfonema magnum]
MIKFFFCHSCFRRNDKLFVRTGSKNLIIECRVLRKMLRLSCLVVSGPIMAVLYQT